MATIERWRESGMAPDRLIASRVSDNRVNMTRPVCPYPQVAQYTGVGSTNDDALEADWNAKLRDLVEAQQEYEQQRETDRLSLTEDQRTRVAALATDFPQLWRDARTSDRERKRMTRLLIEDVTLSKGADILLHVRFKGGATRELHSP